MNLSLSLDAKEVLFHLNYMGYRNVSKEQLKGFMLDLKRLIKFESSPRESTELHIQAGPTSVNIQRLFEAHTITSKTKQKDKPKEAPNKHQQQHQHQNLRQHQQTQHQQNAQHRLRPATIKEAAEEPDKALMTNKRPARPKSAGAALAVETTKQKTNSKDKKKTPEPADKENIPTDHAALQPTKSKMWIRSKAVQVRPKSGSQVGRKPVRRTDPVSLYQAYQKDWEKFKSNICESSHSDLRWSIREKMMGSNR